MAVDTACLDDEQIRGLLVNNLPTTELMLCQGHLEDCADCRKRLEQLAIGNTSMLQVARNAKMDTPPEQGSAYWRALNEVRQPFTPTHSPTSSRFNSSPQPNAITGGKSFEPAKLDFLEPDEDPNFLGRLDRYRLERMVGRGGMGMVFKAVDACLERIVAVKVLDPQVARNETARGRFGREARAAAAVNHPNVVTIYHVERQEARDLSYLVMQYVEGQSLQERIDAMKGPLPVKEVVQIGKQIAEGLAAAHAQGLIHRDIKPANVLLEGKTGRVLLTDFGLARLMEDAKLTQTGFVAGTPLFMSPEQARGEPIDPRSDLFSLGGVLYAMSTGKPPFEGKTPLAVLKQVTEGDFEEIRKSNPLVPDVLTGLIDKLLDKNVNRRIQSAAEVAEILDEIGLRLHRETLTISGRSRSNRLLSKLESGRGRWLSRIGFLALALNVSLLLTEATGMTHLFSRGASGLVTCVQEPRLSFEVKEGPMWALSHSPAADLVAAAMDDGMVKVFTTGKDGKALRKFQAHQGTVWGISFSADGNKLASAGDDGYVRIWNAENWTDQYLKEQQFDPPPKTLAFSPDGKKVMVGLRNGAIRVWDLEHDRVPSTFGTLGHDGAVREILYTPNGESIISVGTDRQILISDAATGTLKRNLQGHKGPIYGIAIEPTGKFLISGSWDQTIRIWDIALGREIETIVTPSKVLAIKFIRDGKEWIHTSSDHHLRRYDFASRKLLSDCVAGDGMLTALTVSADEKSMMTAGWEGILRIFDLK
jgi:eukaryotic-like serine/threonine-protein kinase